MESAVIEEGERTPATPELVSLSESVSVVATSRRQDAEVKA